MPVGSTPPVVEKILALKRRAMVRAPSAWCPVGICPTQFAHACPASRHAHAQGENRRNRFHLPVRATGSEGGGRRTRDGCQLYDANTVHDSTPLSPPPPVRRLRCGRSGGAAAGRGLERPWLRRGKGMIVGSLRCLSRLPRYAHRVHRCGRHGMYTMTRAGSGDPRALCIYARSSGSTSGHLLEALEPGLWAW